MIADYLGQIETGGRLRACVDLAALYSGASSPGEMVVVTVRSVHGTAGNLETGAGGGGNVLWN